MRLFSVRFLTIGVLLLGMALGRPGRADAQIFKVCGDVDDNDAVTVTDGVQVLRAAAGLDSDCTDAICDVDVNGSITVTDGVIILRKAAGLPITENCIPDDGRIDPQVAYILQFTAPLALNVLPTIVLHKNDLIDNSFECDNFADGTYDISVTDGEQDNGFSNCFFDNAIIDGSVDNANDDPALDITIADARSDDTIDLAGSNDSALLGINLPGGGIKYSGRLDASPSFERFDTTSDFLLVVSNLQVAATGFPLGGSLAYEFNSDSGVTGIAEVKVFFDGSNLARVQVNFRNADFKFYKFELKFLNFI